MLSTETFCNPNYNSNCYEKAFFIDLFIRSNSDCNYFRDSNEVKYFFTCWTEEKKNEINITILLHHLDMKSSFIQKLFLTTLQLEFYLSKSHYWFSYRKILYLIIHNIKVIIFKFFGSINHECLVITFLIFNEVERVNDPKNVAVNFAN